MKTLKIILLSIILLLPIMLCAQQEVANQENSVAASQLYPMVLVEAGTFIKGKDDSGVWRNERPLFSISLESYYIGKYEVTQGLWEKVAGEKPKYGRYKGDSLPVKIGWIEAVAFCNVLSRYEGLEPCYRINADTVYEITPGLFPTVYFRTPTVWEVELNLEANGYRLPTEAEWEFAARGGNQSKGYAFSGSNHIDSVAWYMGNANNTTHPVGKKRPNELGIYDMSGNAQEYCWGEDADYDSAYTVRTKACQGPVPADLRLGEIYGYIFTTRGGDIHSGEGDCCSVDRSFFSQGGMRLVRRKE